MCGIFGVWERRGAPIRATDLARATRALAHRGPDDEGFYLWDRASGGRLFGGPQADSVGSLEAGADRAELGFGFRRLSILDLSPAGHQPMRTPDGRFTLVFNGEVYNHAELRAELSSRGCVFRSSSDSEVVLAAFATWGPECTRRFNGMWAIAIWDAARESLWLSRDRFGVKPLLYAVREDTFLFASEAKAIAAYRPDTTRPDVGALAAFVGWNQLPSEADGRTSFVGLQALPPGCSAEITRERVRVTRYYELPAAANEALSPVGAIEAYGQLFSDAVALRLEADVPVGTCLSGGLDSSSIVAQAGALRNWTRGSEQPGQHTFSAVYGGSGQWDETSFIDTVVSHTGATSHRVVPTADRLRAEMDSLLWHQEQPFGTPSIFAQWCVMKLVRETGVTVLLDGQGADEVLGGYLPMIAAAASSELPLHPFRALRIAREAAAGVGAAATGTLLRALAWRLPAALQRSAATAVLRQRARILNRSWSARARDEYQDSIGPSRGDFDEYLRYSTTHRLLHLLRFEDRNSMAHSVEGRTPFLDYRLVELSFGSARRARLQHGWTKWVLRKAVEPILPGSIVWRRGKVGFETPERTWVERLLVDRPDAQVLDPLSDVVNVDAARDVLRRARAGSPEGEVSGLAWRLLLAASWRLQWQSGAVAAPARSAA